MTKKYEVGDVHAPVEDTDVPFSLKLLVVLMIASLITVAFLVGLIANNLHLFSEFMH
jgi:hypothetical protein